MKKLYCFGWLMVFNLILWFDKPESSEVLLLLFAISYWWYKLIWDD